MAEDVVFLVTGHPPMVGKAAFAQASRAQAGQEAPRELEDVTNRPDLRTRVVCRLCGAAVGSHPRLTVTRRLSRAWCRRCRGLGRSLA